jgi:hypothetical protein
MLIRSIADVLSSQFAVIAVVAIGLTLGQPAEVHASDSANWSEATQAVLKDLCLDCHTGSQPDGGLDLSGLSVELRDPESLQRWIRVYDRVDRAEMPPRDAIQPNSIERRVVLEELRKKISRHVRDSRAESGRVKTRRLNSDELANSLEWLLGPSDFGSILPEECPKGGFDTQDSVLAMTEHRMQLAMRTIESAVRTNIERLRKNIPPKTDTILASSMILPSHAEHDNPKKLTMALALDGNDVVVAYKGKVGWPTMLTFGWHAPATAWYRVRVFATPHQTDKPQSIALGAGPVHEMLSMHMHMVGYEEVGFDEDKPAEWFVKLDQGAGLRLLRAESGKNIYRHDRIFLDKYEGDAVRFKRIEVTGPFHSERGANEPMLDQMIKQIADRTTTNWPREVLSKLAYFAYRGRRDSVAVQQAGLAVQEASNMDCDDLGQLGEGLRVLLTSPSFLLRTEENPHLNDFDIATRLSFFLTSMPPDRELLKKAESGQLRIPIELKAEANRLLDSPNSKHFFRRFAAQWLELNRIADTDPDGSLYQWNRHLETAVVQETETYVEDMFLANRSVTAMVNSDYTFVNQPLAEHYGFGGVIGEAMRRVPLPTNSLRAGLWTQASILKVSANGTTTSPIVRGVWVLQNLLDEPPPPPPPGVPAVEPDTRGTTTIRDQLAVHKSQTECAACHQYIDPLGFALESFDPTGAQRTVYRLHGKKPEQKNSGPKVDPSGVLAGGETFQDIRELRRHLLKEPERLAKALVRKLIVYGTGHEVDFADREVVDRIVDNTANDEYRVRDLLLGIIQSDLFLTP